MRKLLFYFPARFFVGATMILLALTSGCTYLHGPEPIPEPILTANPCGDAAPATYAAVISPLFDANCRKCHGATVYKTLGGGNDYSTYQGIKNQSADLILGCVQHRNGYDPMPKGNAQLSACDIARIKSWIDAGQPNN